MSETSSLVVPGIPEDEIWQLEGCWWFSYYLQKVREIPQGICPFCPPDPTINHILAENDSWYMWDNPVQPLPGQDFQLVIPPKRHVLCFGELTDKEFLDLRGIVGLSEELLGIQGGGLLLRMGDYKRSARSVPHLHFNYHVPTGKVSVRPFLCKSAEDRKTALDGVLVFEKMRRLLAGRRPDPNLLVTLVTDAEWQLVKDRLAPPPKK